jgi:hypothetical protein
MIVMPKHTIIAPRTFRDLLQFTPFIYPPTPFGYGRRQHMILVCLGITIMVYRGLIWLNCTIVTTILAAKVLPLQVFSVPDQHY